MEDEVDDADDDWSVSPPAATFLQKNGAGQPPSNASSPPYENEQLGSGRGR